MKRKVLALVLASVTAFSLTACGSSSSTSSAADSSSAEASESGTTESTAESSALESGAADGVLTVGFDAEYPPYGYMGDDGEYTGFDLELAQAVCDLEGWELVKTPINWDSKDIELNSGSIDCIWNGFTRNGREDDYTFSISYVDNSQVMVVAKDSGITSFDDLAGKIVGVQQASAALDVLDGDQAALAATFGELQQFSDYNTAFTELQAGALQALAIDVGVAKYQIESRGDGYTILDETLNSEEYAVGCRKGDTELADTLSKDIKKLYEDGTVMELAEKYGIADMIAIED